MPVIFKYEKLQSILEGWKNYFFVNQEVEIMAKFRAVECAKCPFSESKWYAELINDEMTDIEGMVCTKCDCPLSTKLRSKEETCPESKWD